MIRDVAELRRTGVASRRVAELDIPATAWRAAMCHAVTRTAPAYALSHPAHRR